LFALAISILGGNWKAKLERHSGFAERLQTKADSDGNVTQKRDGSLASRQAQVTRP
jgi:hypothetical protein